MASTHKLVRIKPSNKREVHVSRGYVIKKSDGWVKVPAAVADQLAIERMNSLNPEASPFVFDVYDEDRAQLVADAEAVRAEPPGTVSAPKAPRVIPTDDTPEPSRARRRAAGA